MTEKERRERREFMARYRALTLAQQQEFWKRNIVAPGKRYKIVRDIWLVADPPNRDDVDVLKYVSNADETSIAHLPSGLWATWKMKFDDVVETLEQHPEQDEHLLNMMPGMDASFGHSVAALKITYDGDITAKLRESKTQCPFWLGDDGDTRQVVDVHRGLASADASQEEFERLGEAAVLQEAAKNGRIKSHTWVYRHPDMSFDDVAKQYRREDEAHVSPPPDAGDDEKVIERMLRALEDSELLRRYSNHCRRHGIGNTRPEHAFGAKLYASWVCFSAARGNIPVFNEQLEKASDKSARKLAFRMGGAVHVSEIYLWADKTERIADQAPLPEHTVSYMTMPSPSMLWVHESPIKNTANGVVSTWMLLLHDKSINSMIVAMDGYSEDDDLETTKLVVTVFPFGKLWPRDYPDRFGQLLKRCAFLGSPYVTTAPQRLPHHIRRQIERGQIEAGANALEDAVHVVLLRRAQVRPAQERSEQHGEVREVEWQHQWWVKQHYRAQWYPSERAHKIIYIERYLKGPRDKPILEKLYSVIR